MGWLKKGLIGFSALVSLVAVGLAGFVYFHTSAYDASLDKVYEVPLPKVELSKDEAVLARGSHLAHSVAPCAASDCHGKDLGGGKVTNIGPIGTLAAPNITTGGLGAAYSDAELARLLVHGLKKDGRGVRFMSSHEFNWLPDHDVAAVVSYVRSQPAQSRTNEGMQIGTLGKVLDRLDMIPIDVARRIDHANVEKAPAPTPTPAYGRFIGRLCTGCHGANLSGGPIPGAPPEMAIPLNLTPHETGTKGWTLSDFKKVMTTGVRKDGRKLDPMMPVESFGQFDDVEMQALYSYLQTLPPTAFGNR
jgi:cytochrome c553